MSDVEGLVLKLNAATRRWHTFVDEPWLQLLRSDVTRSDYLAHLVRMYGYEAPLESACAYTPQLSRVIESRQLRRAGLIAQDLLALGLTPADVAAVPQCFSITPFNDVSQALGWLYVIERSTLYHDQVRRHLLLRVPGVGRACAYLHVFDGVPDHWRRFGRILDRVGSAPDTATQIIDAAHQGFACMETWLRSSAPRLRSSA